VKIGIDSYCFHRFFGEVYDGQPVPAASMTMDDFLAFAKDLDVDGVSLESCFLPSMGESWLVELRAKLDRYDFERVYAWGHPSGLEDGTNRAAFDDMVAQIRNASLIGAKVMRVTPGPGPTDFRKALRQPRLEVLARWYREAVEIARRHDVKLAAENHGDYTSEEMLWLVEAVDSPYFGVTFDTGNFLRVEDDPVRAMERLAKHTFATHIKDVKVRAGSSPADWPFYCSVPVGDGVVDVTTLIRLLGAADYTGLLAVEIDYLSPDNGYDEHAAVRKSITELRGIVDGLN
jgi:sugar phosphate isomerase/epimerase